MIRGRKLDVSSVHTILFDLDGTLIDTNDLIAESFVYTFKQYGLDYTKDEVQIFNGPPLIDTFEKINYEQSQEMFQTYIEHNLYHHDYYVKAFPYVVDTVKKLRKQGIKLAIVTSKMKENAKRGIKISGLDGMFETIVALDDVTHAKPHPESILKAMEELNANKETTLMVGDNSHDIEAGHNAEIRSAGVSWSVKGKEFLQKFQPTYMLNDIRDILDLVK